MSFKARYFSYHGARGRSSAIHWATKTLAKRSPSLHLGHEIIVWPEYQVREPTRAGGTREASSRHQSSHKDVKEERYYEIENQRRKLEHIDLMIYLSTAHKGLNE